jgi:hypothetical protein
MRVDGGNWRTAVRPGRRNPLERFRRPKTEAELEPNAVRITGPSPHGTAEFVNERECLVCHVDDVAVVNDANALSVVIDNLDATAE